MCSVSMVGDYYGQKWGGYPPQQGQQGTLQQGIFGVGLLPAPVSKEDFDALRKEVMDMKELLKRAIDYDKKTGQPDCHLEEKLSPLRKVAELVGVTLEDILPQETK